MQPFDDAVRFHRAHDNTSFQAKLLKAFVEALALKRNREVQPRRVAADSALLAKLFLQRIDQRLTALCVPISHRADVPIERARAQKLR